MKLRFIHIPALLGLMGSGLMFAQAPHAHRAPDGARGAFAQGMRLGMDLNLTAEQQNKIHTVMQEAQVQRQGMAQKMRDLRTQMTTAVKAGDEASIDRVSQDMAALHQQETSIQAKAMAKVYATLTPDQKTKFEPQLNRSVGGGPGGFGPMGRPMNPNRAQPRQPVQQ